MKVRAKEKMYYSPDKREYAPGEEYEMDDREWGEAKILETLGKIEIVKDDEPQPKSRQLRTTAMEAEDDKSGEVAPMTTENTEALADHPNRRVYRRRDMKPQE